MNQNFKNKNNNKNTSTNFMTGKTILGQNQDKQSSFYKSHLIQTMIEGSSDAIFRTGLTKKWKISRYSS